LIAPNVDQPNVDQIIDTAQATSNRTPAGVLPLWVVASHMTRHPLGLRSTMASPTGWHCFGPELVVVPEDIDVLSIGRLEGGSPAGDKHVAVDQYRLVAVA
jgi:hypothetical protein